MTDKRTAEDWEEAALDAIAEGGLRALAIPTLATTLGVTKGSFYWHFEGLDALVEAALKRWEAADKEAIDELARVADPRRRLRAAFTESLRLERAHGLFVTLASSSDARVTASLRRVSTRRMRFLVDAYSELGLSEEEAKARALLAYTAYVGALHLRRQALAGLKTEAALEAYARHAAETLIP